MIIYVSFSLRYVCGNEGRRDINRALGHYVMKLDETVRNFRHLKARGKKWREGRREGGRDGRVGKGGGGDEKEAGGKGGTSGYI